MRVLLSIALCGMLSYAQEYNLQESYNQALEHNKNLKVYEQQVQISKNNIAISEAPLRPNVKLTYHHNYNFHTATTQSTYTDTPVTFDTTSADLSITQRIYDNEAIGAYDQSKITYKKSVLEYEIYKEQLLIDIAENYLQILFLEESYLVTQKKIETLQQQLADIKTRFDLGNATVQDLTYVESRYQLAQYENIEALSNLNIAKEKFQISTGVSLTQDTTLKSIEIDPSVKSITSLDTYINEANENNLQLKLKEIELLLSKKILTDNKRGHIPKINLIGGRKYYRTEKSISSLETYDTRQSYLGVQIEASLYSGHETTNKVVQAKKTIELQKLKLESTKEELKHNIVTEYMNIKKYKIQITSLNVALKSAKTTVDASKVGFNVGSRTHYEVLEAIESYYTIKNSISDVQYQFTLSLLKLKMLSGKLSQEDLQI